MAESPHWLESFPVLRGGRVDRRLSAGLSADSWLVETPDSRCVVRVDRPLARRLGLDRHNEWRVLQVAHAAGLAPRPLHSDPRRGILVAEYVAKPSWSDSDLRSPGGLESLGRLLRRVHGQPGVGRRFDPPRIAECYARAAGQAGLGSEVNAITRLSEALQAGAGTALCHHDPHAGNLLGSDPPLLIDWEYAACGQPLFDLSAVIRYHRLGPAEADRLVCAWAGESAAGHRDTLDAFCQLYDRLSGLWELAVARG